MKVTTTLKIAWDSSDPLLTTVDTIYLYPSTMADEDILEDLIDYNALNAIVRI